MWAMATRDMNRPELTAEDVIDMFNTDGPGALNNPAVAVADIDQTYTCEYDHRAFEIEANVELIRTHDLDPTRVLAGLDT